MYATLDEYFYFYKKFLMQTWDNMGPEEYVFVLLGVGLSGWYLMRKAASL